MNKSNKDICLNSYKELNPKSNSLILELGMGNGYFINELLALNDNLKYIGLDCSQAMIDEATTLNQKLINEQKVSFVNGSIENLPLIKDSIDYVITTNTVCFWPNLAENAKEIYRV
jgi:ubiquinone/menaquinone biosynthesis C-methylase UbiE